LRLRLRPVAFALNQTDYLLDQQLRQLEAAFVEEGGFTERLYKVRSERKMRG
jgi:four helix bundle suffix protein